MVSGEDEAFKLVEQFLVDLLLLQKILDIREKELFRFGEALLEPPEKPFTVSVYSHGAP